MLTHAQIVERLEQIEESLAELEQPHAFAAEQAHRTAREWELRFAKGRLVAKGATQTEKKDRALEAIAAADDDLYERYTEAQAEYEGGRAAMKVLETRATIGMALLKAHSRAESPVSPTGPTYGGRS